LLKRGDYGTYHWLSFKHLHRYVSEYVYRHTTRGLKGLVAIDTVTRAGDNECLTYADLTS